MAKFNRRFHGNAGDGQLHTHHIRSPDVLPFHMTPSNILCRGGETNPKFWVPGRYPNRPNVVWNELNVGDNRGYSGCVVFRVNSFFICQV